MAPVQLEDCSCPLGCPVHDEVVLTGHDRWYNRPGEFQVVRCRTCGLMRTNPRPTMESIHFYYPDDYQPHAAISANIGPISLLYKRVAHRLLNMERLPSLQPGRMLEFGCGSGKFLHRMAKQGWEVEGIEIAETPARTAQDLGYTVFIGALESAPTPPHLYDLVVGWMVLEHLHQPVEALRKLLDWTRPGGWLVASVPNAAALEFRVFADAWYALELPRHLHHFTPTTLKRVLEASGWRMERILHQRTLANLAGSAGYVLRDSRYRGKLVGLARILLGFHSSGLAHILTFPLAFLLAGFGQTGRMTVWARKPDTASAELARRHLPTTSCVEDVPGSGSNVSARPRT